MRAMVNDVIGTKDGRYGTVIAIVKGMLTVAEATPADEPCAEQATYFSCVQSDVASIV